MENRFVKDLKGGKMMIKNLRKKLERAMGIEPATLGLGIRLGGIGSVFARYLGHASISTTEIYLHSLEKGLQEASNNLDELLK
jgi:integrase